MDSKQFAALVAEADTQLSKLRSLYDQWFAGVERIEPQQQRDTFDRLMKTLDRECPNNTASRFRHQQLVQRYLTYTTYWRRIGRQIEEGTFKRDVAKAQKLRKQRQEPSRRGQEVQDLDMDLDMELDLDTILESATALAPALPDGRSSRKPPPPPPTQARTAAPDNVQPSLQPPPTDSSRLPPSKPRFRPPETAPANSTSSSASSQLSQRQLRDIYERFVAARAKNNERTDNVQVDSIARSVEGMMPKLREKHAGKQIDFEVVVRDGKVALKPVAK